MKKILLATVATLALTASGFAAEPEHGKAGAAMKGQAEVKGSAQTQTPAAGAKADTKGQAQAPAGKSEMKGTASKTDKSRTTTGQGTESKTVQPEPKANSNTIKNDNGPKGARSGEGGRMGEKAGDRNERMGEKAGDRNERTGQRTGESNRTGESSRQAGSDRSGGSVSLTAEQKTKIRTTVVAKGPKVERSKISFSLNVGTRIPRGSVHFVAVPATLIEIHPAWRGYEYFVVGDEIVIVDPRTLEIIAIVAV